MGVTIAIGQMVLSFIVLAKCADWLVDGAVDLASLLRVPDILIGIVIVSVGTTAPELAVSVQAALSGEPEISLGNAVGSVIYDDGVALPLVAILAPVAVVIDAKVLRSAAIFLITIDLLAYWLCRDGVLQRSEGAFLVVAFFLYLAYTYWEQKRDPARSGDSGAEALAGGRSVAQTLVLFAVGLVGVLVASHFIVDATPVVAEAMGVSSTIVALVLVALGTSVPEIATCIVSARKGHGALAVGNILGADILNVCWIAGAASLVNDLDVGRDVINFMFPSMLVIVFTMLALLRHRHRFDRWKGVVLLVMFSIYLALVLIQKPGGAWPG